MKKEIEDYTKDWNEEAQKRENFIDFPLRYYKQKRDKIKSKTIIDYKEVEYCLYTSINSESGRVSIQYVGDDNTFLTHKEIIRAIKIENNI